MTNGWKYFAVLGDERIALPEGQVILGRSRKCEIPISDPSISRKHAQATVGQGRIVVRDLGSSNGTFVNDARLDAPTEVTDGDALRLGDAELRIQIVAPVPAEDLATRRIDISGAAGSTPPGEATTFLQRASVQLARDALGSEDSVVVPSAPPTASPPPPTGFHMAPPPPAVQPPAPPPQAPPPAVAPPTPQAPPMAATSVSPLGAQTTRIEPSELANLTASPGGEGPSETNPPTPGAPPSPLVGAQTTQLDSAQLAQLTGRQSDTSELGLEGSTDPFETSVPIPPPPVYRPPEVETPEVSPAALDGPSQAKTGFVDTPLVTPEMPRFEPSTDFGISLDEPPPAIESLGAEPPAVELGAMDAEPSFDSRAFELVPEDDPPSFETSQPEIPSLEPVLPDPPEADLPDYDRPTAGMTPVETPSFDTPSFDTPLSEAPSFETPSFDAPFETPSFDAPFETPSFDAPFETPSFETPAAEAPSFETPAAEPPSFEPPAVEPPSFEPPSYEIPSFGAPSVDGPTVKLPSFDSPGLPSLEEPPVSPPSLEASSTDLPQLQTPTAAPTRFDGPPSLDPLAEPTALGSFGTPPAPMGDFDPGGGVDDTWGPISLSPTSTPGGAHAGGMPPGMQAVGGADIRAMTPGTGSAGGGEMLSPLDGFDTTFGPGAEVPEPFQRAHESVARAQEEVAESSAVAGGGHNPYQPPGAAMAASNLAGFGIRFLAVLLDWVWMVGLSLAAFFVVPNDLQMYSSIGLALFNFLVVLVGWSVWGTTPGKRALGLYVCDAEGKPGIGPVRAFLRMVGYVISGIPLFIGFLMALSKDRRALHDRIAGTTVRRM